MSGFFFFFNQNNANVFFIRKYIIKYQTVNFFWALFKYLHSHFTIDNVIVPSRAHSYRFYNLELIRKTCTSIIFLSEFVYVWEINTYSSAGKRMVSITTHNGLIYLRVDMIERLYIIICLLSE